MPTPQAKFGAVLWTICEGRIQIRNSDVEHFVTAMIWFEPSCYDLQVVHHKTRPIILKGRIWISFCLSSVGSESVILILYIFYYYMDFYQQISSCNTPDRIFLKSRIGSNRSFHLRSDPDP